MRIDVVTLFPEWFASPLDAALLGKARACCLLDVRLHNPRDLALDRHKTVDARPYGGGPGMVMTPDPVVRTLRGLTRDPCPKRRLLLLSASGRPFTQAMARELTEFDQIILVCGRYEGIDARVERLLPLEPICVGEAVLNGGEAAALMIIEAVSRLMPGFMGKEASSEEESFSAGLLEYPHYTRPEEYEGLEVPEVLRGGAHARISDWRRKQSLLLTWRHRPEMLDKARLTPGDLAYLRALPPEDKCECLGRNLYIALLHHPVILEKNLPGPGDEEKKRRIEKSGTSSLTNLDVHDIARSSCAYGLAGYYLVTPLDDQRRLLDNLLVHWTIGAGGRSNPDRAEALRLVRGAGDLQEVVAAITVRAGQRPLVVGTSARSEGVMTFAGVRDVLRSQPVLLVLGTAQGLAQDAVRQCDAMLRPVRGPSAYNHLPVRGAAVVILDRILGDWH